MDLSGFLFRISGGFDTAEIDGVFKGDGVSAVEEAVEEGGGEGVVVEELGPVAVAEVCGDECAFFSGTQVNQPKKLMNGVGSGIDVAELINDEDVELGQAMKKKLGGSIGGGGAELVEKVLGFKETTRSTAVKSLQQEG